MVKRTEGLFHPKRNPYYPLNDILHFFAKRLQIPPSETLMMDEERRDEIFKIEKKIMDKENKNPNQI